MKKTGFSLVELMISLIVISIITAAFSPVVTKKLKASGAAYIASGGSASTTCTNMSGGGGTYCKLCTKNTTDGICLLCERTCPYGQTLDYDGCTCKTCPSNCRICGLSTNNTTDSTTCYTCNDGYYLNSSNTCSACSTNCEECTSGTECKKCKKGYDIDPVTKACVISCNDKDLIRIGDLCVTKYNMGDKRKFPIPDSVKMFRIGQELTLYDETIPFCIYGITSKKDNCDSKNGSYSGCGRTVCNWYAAREICSKLSLNGVAWRLPTKTEALTFEGYTKNLENNGLQLCSYSDYSGVSRCAHGNYKYSYTTGGGGSAATTISYVLTDTQISSSQVYALYKYGGSLTNTSTSKHLPASVRCVQGGYPDISTICSDPHCITCSSDGLTCTKCDDNYTLESNKCWLKCSSGEYAKMEGSMASQACYDCSTANCKTCANGTGTCTSCNDGYALTSSKTCQLTSCGTNKYLSGGVCKPCPSGQHYCDGVNLDPCSAYQTGSNAICKACVKDVTNGGVGCTLCEKGAVVGTPYAHSYMVYACVDCPSACPDSCTTDSSGTTLKCPASTNCGTGKYLDTSNYTCKTCPSDSQCDGVNMYQCKQYVSGSRAFCKSCTDAVVNGGYGCQVCENGAPVGTLMAYGIMRFVCTDCPSSCPNSCKPNADFSATVCN